MVTSKRVKEFMKAIDMNGPRTRSEIQGYQLTEVRPPQTFPQGSELLHKQASRPGPARPPADLQAQAPPPEESKRLLSQRLMSEVLELKKTIDFGPDQPPLEVTGAHLQRLWGIDLGHPSFTAVGHDDRLNTGRSLSLVYFYQRTVVIFFFKLDVQEFYRRHQHPITALALSTDSLVASADFGTAATILVWNLATRQTLKVLQRLHFLPVTMLAFFGGNRYLFTAAFTQQSHVLVYDLSRNEVCLSFLEPHLILELSDPSRDTPFPAPFSAPSRLAYVTAEEVHLLTSRDRPEGIHFARQKCILGKLKHGAGLTALLAATEPDGSTQLVLGHQNGAVTVWRDFEYQFTLTVYEEPVRSLVRVAGVGLAVLHGDTGLSMWGHALDKHFRLLDTGNMRLLKLPFLQIRFLVHLAHRLLVVTDFMEIVQLKFAPNQSYAGKKRTKRLLPLLQPKLDTCEFALKAQGGRQVLVCLAAEALLVFFDLESSDYTCSLHFQDTRVVGFDVVAAEGRLTTAVATSDGRLQVFSDHELRDQLSCFDPEDFRRIKLTSSPDFVALLLRGNRVALRSVTRHSVSRAPPTVVSLDEAFVDFFDLRYHKKGQKLTVFSAKNSLYKIEDLKGRCALSAFGTKNFFSKKFLFSFQGLNGRVVKALLCQSGLAVMTVHNELCFFGSENNIQSGACLSLALGQADLSHVVFGSGSETVFCGERRAVFKVGVSTRTLDTRRLDMARALTLKRNTVLEEEVRLGRRKDPEASEDPENDFLDAFAYASAVPDPGFKGSGGTGDLGAAQTLLRSKIRPFKSQEIDATDVAMFGKRAPLTWLRLKRICGFQGLGFRNNLAYVHAYQSDFLELTDAVPNRRRDPVEGQEVPDGFIDDLIVSKHRHYPYDRQHKACAKEVVYFVSKYGVVFDPKTHRQRFYSAHDHSVTALAVSSSKRLVATGDSTSNRACCIRVWRAADAFTLFAFRCRVFERTLHLRFSNFDEYLGAVGALAGPGTYHLVVFDVANRLTLASMCLGTELVLDLQFNNYVASEMAVAGMNLIRRVSLEGAALETTEHIRLDFPGEDRAVGPKAGSRTRKNLASLNLEDSDPQGRCVCVTVCQYFYYLLGEKLDTDFLIGTVAGEVGIAAFGSAKFSSVGHRGPVNAIKVTDVIQNIVVVISAGEDGCIKFWNTKLELISELDLTAQSFSSGVTEGVGFNHAPQSLDIFACDSDRGSRVGGGKAVPETYPKVLLVGTRNSEIVEVVLSTEFLGIATQQSRTLILNRQVLRPDDPQENLQIYDLKKREKIIFDACLVTRFNSNVPFFTSTSPTPTLPVAEASLFLYGPPPPLKDQLLQSLEASRRRLRFELTPDGRFCLTFGTNCDVFVWNVATQRLQTRLLVQRTPLALRFLPTLQKLLVFGLDGRLAVYGYRVDAGRDQFGMVTYTFDFNAESLWELEVALESAYLDVTVVPNFDLEDEGASGDDQSELSEATLGLDQSQTEPESDPKKALRDFTVFFHEASAVEGLKSDQSDLDVLHAAVLTLARDRPPRNWHPRIAPPRTLTLPYLKGHPLFLRESNQVTVFRVDRLTPLPDGNVSLELLKHTYVGSTEPHHKEVHCLVATLEGDGSFEFGPTLRFATEAETSRLNQIKVSRTEFVMPSPEETGVRPNSLSVVAHVTQNGTEFFGTQNGCILVSKPLGDHLLAEDLGSRSHPRGEDPPPREVRMTPTQMRVVPAHANPVSLMRMSASLPCLVSVGANENCVMFWEVVRGRSFYDLDGLVYNTRVAEHRFQEASNPRVFEHLIRTWQQTREELVHLKAKAAQKGGVILALEKAIGRTASGRRNNLYLSYDNKIVFCLGSLVCLMAAGGDGKRQEFLMAEAQMPPGFIAPPISTFAVSTDRRFMVVGTTELPSRLYFWEICYKVCYFQMALDNAVQVVKMEYSPQDLFVLVVCLTKDYTQAVLVLSGTADETPRVLAACELRYSPVFKILSFAFKPDNPFEFVTAGEQHFCRWKIQGATLLCQEVALEVNEEIGKAGNYHQKRHRRLVAEQAYVDPQQIQSTFLTVSYVEPDLLVTGSTDGTLHFWHNYSLIMIETGHRDAAILCTATCPFYKSHILTGGADGLVNLFKIKNGLELNQFVLERLSGFKIARDGPGLAIQSLVFVERMIFAGSENGDIVQFEMAKLTSADTVKESDDVIRPFYRCWNLEEYFRLDFSNDSRFIFAVTRSGSLSVYATADLGLLLRTNLARNDPPRAPQANPKGNPQGDPQANPTGNPQGDTQANPTGDPQRNPQGPPGEDPRSSCLSPPDKRGSGDPEGAGYGAIVNMVVCQLNPFVLVCFARYLQALHSPQLVSGKVVPAADLDFPAVPGLIFDMKLNRREDLIAIAYTDAETHEPNISLQAVDFGRRVLTPVRLAMRFLSIKFVDFSVDNYYLFYHDEMAHRDYYVSLNDRTVTADAAPHPNIFCLNEGVLHSPLRNRLKEFYHEGNQVNCIVRLSDATCIVSDAYGTVRVFEVSKGSASASQVSTQHLGDTNIMRLSSDKMLLLTASRADKSIFIWKVGTPDREGPPNPL